MLNIVNLKTNFSNNAFLKDLKSLLSKFDNEKNVPISYERANQIPFINKTLNKEIMKRSRLRNKKQRNHVVRSTRKGKESFHSTLDTSVVTENKKIWKTVKLFY